MKKVLDAIKRFVWPIIVAIGIGASALVSQCTQLFTPKTPPAITGSFAPSPEPAVTKKVAKTKPARKAVKPRPKLVKLCYDDSLRFLGSERICWMEEVKK